MASKWRLSDDASYRAASSEVLQNRLNASQVLAKLGQKVSAVPEPATVLNDFYIRSLAAMQQSFAEVSAELEATKAELQSNKQGGASEDVLSQVRKLQLKLRDAEQKASSAANDSLGLGKLLSRLKPLSAAATKIQANWRGTCQRRKFFEMLDNFANRTGRIAKSQASDELIMRQVAGAAKHKNLTLEQLFRAADTDSDGIVKCDDLSRVIQTLKLGLTPAQITRLNLILDEDYSGRIEQKEFYNALAAYRVATENHRSSDRSYEQEVLVKFVEVLDHRKIDPEEIFGLCDVNSDGSISTEELKTFVTGLNIGFQNKEVHALMKILDADGSGKVSRDEYAKHMQKGTAVFKIESAMAGTSAAAQP